PARTAGGSRVRAGAAAAAGGTGGSCVFPRRMCVSVACATCGGNVRLHLEGAVHPNVALMAKGVAERLAVCRGHRRDGVRTRRVRRDAPGSEGREAGT